MRKRILARLVLAAVAVGLALLAWWLRRGPARPLLVLAAARAGPLVATWSATGYVEARKADVSAPQVGRVLAVMVREGDTVRRGQVLARFSSTVEAAGVRVQEEAVRAAEAQVAAARTALREAEASLEGRLARAEAEVAAARARQRQANATLIRSRQTARASLEAARARAAAARAQLSDLQSGARPEEIARAEAAVEAASATAARAQTERRRQETLLQEGAVPRRAVEEAVEAEAQATAALRRAREELSLVRKGSRAQEIEAARARVRAAEGEVAAARAALVGTTVEARLAEEAAAGVEAAEAGLAEVRAGAKRIATLVEEVRAAEARLDQARALEQQARAGLTERTVLAPFSGTIGRRYVDPGDVITPPQPLFSVVEAGNAWVVAEVDAQDLAAVHEDQPVTISAAAYPGRSFSGLVASIGAEAIPQTEARTSARIVRVRISLSPVSPRDRPLLKPGMEVDVSGKAELVARAVLVPNDAVLTDTSGTYVLVAVGERYQRRRVRIGYIGSTETEVLSGLRAGERVVVSGKDVAAPD